MQEQEIVVLGGGNGALAFAAYLGLRGRKVSLWEFPEFRKSLAWIYENEKVIAEGEIQGDTGIKCHDSLKTTLRGATVVMAVVPAFAHRRLAEEIAPFLEPDAVLVLNPGRTGGALEVGAILHAAGRVNPVAEAQTLLFACRRKGESTIHFNGLKHLVRVGVLPAKQTEKVIARLHTFLPQFQAVSNVLATSLGNIGAVFHPASTILNTGIVESQEDYDYYPATMTPSVVKVIEEIDRERMAIARAAGAEASSAQAWLRESYQLPEGSLYSMLQNNRAYRGIPGPKVVQERHVTEDVPMGLVPMEALAQLYEVATPTISALISLANSLIGEDFRSTGRNLKRLGLCGMTPADVAVLVREGLGEDFTHVGRPGGT
jgi:opine dehydrogenase